MERTNNNAMTVGNLIERLLRLPDFAADMVVTIRDEEHNCDYPICTSTAPIYLEFNFSNEADEAAWREGRRTGTVLDRLLSVHDLDIEALDDGA